MRSRRLEVEAASQLGLMECQFKEDHNMAALQGTFSLLIVDYQSPPRGWPSCGPNGFTGELGFRMHD
jgi:hypothetical protein